MKCVWDIKSFISVKDILIFKFCKKHLSSVGQLHKNQVTKGSDVQGVGRTQKLYVRPPCNLKSWTSDELSSGVYIKHIKLALHLSWGKFIWSCLACKLKNVCQKGSDVHLKVPAFDLFIKTKTKSVNKTISFFNIHNIITILTVSNLNYVKAYIWLNVCYKLWLSNLAKLSAIAMATSMPCQKDTVHCMKLYLSDSHTSLF